MQTSPLVPATRSHIPASEQILGRLQISILLCHVPPLTAIDKVGNSIPQHSFLSCECQLDRCLSESGNVKDIVATDDDLRPKVKSVSIVHADSRVWSIFETLIPKSNRVTERGGIWKEIALPVDFLWVPSQQTGCHRRELH